MILVGGQAPKELKLMAFLIEWHHFGRAQPLEDHRSVIQLHAWACHQDCFHMPCSSILHNISVVPQSICLVNTNSQLVLPMRRNIRSTFLSTWTFCMSMVCVREVLLLRQNLSHHQRMYYHPVPDHPRLPLLRRLDQTGRSAPSLSLRVHPEHARAVACAELQISDLQETITTREPPKYVERRVVGPMMHHDLPDNIEC